MSDNLEKEKKVKKREDIIRILTKEIMEITEKIRRRGSKCMTTTSSQRKAYTPRMERTSIKSYMRQFLNRIGS